MVTNKVTVPYVIEPAAGLDRIFLTILTDAYAEEQNVPSAKDKAKPVNYPYDTSFTKDIEDSRVCDQGDADGETRVVLRLHEDLAPYKFAVLPLMKKVCQRASLLVLGCSRAHPPSSSSNQRSNSPPLPSVFMMNSPPASRPTTTTRPRSVPSFHPPAVNEPARHRFPPQARGIAAKMRSARPTASQSTTIRLKIRYVLLSPFQHAALSVKCRCRSS